MKTVQAGRIGQRKVTAMTRDGKISARTKTKIYKAVVRSVMLYDKETVPLTK